MKKFLMNSTVKKSALFVGGVIVGGVSNKVAACPCVKKVAVHTTALVLKAKDDVLDLVSKVQANVEDVIAEAKEVNEAKLDDCTCGNGCAPGTCEGPAEDDCTCGNDCAPGTCEGPVEDDCTCGNGCAPGTCQG